ncbi:tol-pal system protein YbgF [Microbaculum marinum]|uniref:Cell division coordinator CpoB n=2 Tax=Microbaculum marinum TaxID=1764581 RepID=A0AAW9RUU0_9HYPH
MAYPSSRCLVRLLCVAAIGTSIAVVLAGTASAQFLQRGDSQADVAGLTVRLNTLEDQVRQLNGQIEQLNFQIRQLQQQAMSSGNGGVQGQVPGQSSMGSSGTVLQPRMPSQMQQGSGMNQGGSAGAPPQSLGQVPGRPLDLSSALGQPLPQSGQDQSMFNTPAVGGQNPQLVLAPSGDPKDAYDLSYGYILRGEFDLAEASFRQFLNQFPNDPLAGNAQYWLGESLFARNDYRQAADAFLKGYSDYPDSAKAPDSLYKLGMSLKELGQADAACSTFAEIARRYPNAPQAVQERARSEMQKSGCS